MGAVVEQVRALVEAAHAEIVLTASTSRAMADLPGAPKLSLTKQILRHVPN